MSDREAEIQPNSTQKLQAIRRYVGELRAQQEAQSSNITSTPSTPRTMQNPPNIEPQPPIPQPNPPNPNVVDLSRTLKELAAPTLDQQPLGITYPPLEVAFELKSGMIHLLPTFHGFAGEDPNKHLNEFFSLTYDSFICDNSITLRTM